MSSNKKFYTVTKANAEIIDKYLDYYKTKKANLSERSLRNIKETLKKLADFLNEKSLKDTNEQTLIDFFSDKKRVTVGSRDTYANHIIPFYRYIEQADKHSRPTNMKWFDFTTAREKRKMIKPNKKQEQFITSDEYNKIISYQYDRFGQTNALWETYYLSGTRTHELLSMKIKHIIFDKNSISISVIDSKSIPRQIPLTEKPEYLFNYLNNHPQKNNPDAVLWFSLKNINKQLSPDAVRNRFREIIKNLKLKDTLTVQSFRKTRATIMFQNKTRTQDMAKFFGWTINTAILRSQEYDLSDYEDLKKQILKKPYTPETPKTISQRNKVIDKQEETIHEMQKQITFLQVGLEIITEAIQSIEGKDLSKLTAYDAIKALAKDIKLPPEAQKQLKIIKERQNKSK